MVTVLVVDDSLMDQRLTGGLIAKVPGFRPVYANNGVEALRVMTSAAPDIVVTDLHMPEMDGLSLVEALRRDFPTVPVVLMTAHGSEEIAVKALQKGASSYVPKRNLAKELALTVTNVLDVARGERDLQKVLNCMERSETSFVLGPDPSIVTPLVKHLEGHLVRMRLCDQAESIQVAVALREALTNAFYRGNLELSSELREGLDGAYDALAATRLKVSPYRERRVFVTVSESKDKVVYVIRDEGGGFDPLSLPDPTDPGNIERSSGRGLFLIRTFMDEVSHNAIGNEIRMVKRRSESGAASSLG